LNSANRTSTILTPVIHYYLPTIVRLFADFLMDVAHRKDTGIPDILAGKGIDSTIALCRSVLFHIDVGMQGVTDKL